MGSDNTVMTYSPRWESRLLMICPDVNPTQCSTPLQQIQLSRQWQLPPPMVAKSQRLRIGLLWLLEVGHCTVLLHQVHRQQCMLFHPSLHVELIQPLLPLVNRL